MQVTRTLCAALVGALLLMSAQAGADYSDEDERDNQELINSGGDGQTGTGTFNPFKSIFGVFSGDDIYESLEGKFIDKLEKEATFKPPQKGLAEQGTLLLRSTNVAIADIPALEEHANMVLQRLVKVAPMADLEAKLVIIAKGDFDARSTPDGGIFLSHGMLRNLRSEDELAFVLAHELSHIILLHHGTDWFVSARKHATAMAEIAFTLQAAIKSRSASGEMSMSDKLKFVAVSTAVEVLSDSVLWPSFSRDQEDQADLLGADLAIKAGYSPLGIIGFFEMLAKADDNKAAKSERQAKNYDALLEKQFKEKGLGGLVDGISGLMVDELGNIGKEVKKSLGDDHRTTEERDESISAYVEREYEELMAQESKMESYVTVKSDPSVAAILRAYRIAEQAEESATDGDLDRAQGFADRATQTDLVRNHSFPYIKAGNVWLSKGDAQNAGRNFHHAIQTNRAPLKSYKRLAELHRDHNQWQQTRSVLGRAEKEFGTQAELMPLRILVAHKDRDKAQIASLLIECKVNGENEMYKACKKSSEGQFDPGAYSVALTDVTLGAVANRVWTKPNSLNVRAGPSSRDKKLFALGRNSKLAVLERNKGWLRIQDTQNRQGWVSARFTAKQPSKKPRVTKKAPIASTKKPLPAPAVANIEPAAGSKARVAAPPPNDVKSREITKTSGTSGEAQAPAAVEKKGPSLEERLERLKKLHARGLITDEEYKKKREDLLEQL